MCLPHCESPHSAVVLSAARPPGCGSLSQDQFAGWTGPFGTETGCRSGSHWNTDRDKTDTVLHTCMTCRVDLRPKTFPYYTAGFFVVDFSYPKTVNISETKWSCLQDIHNIFTTDLKHNVFPFSPADSAPRPLCAWSWIVPCLRRGHSAGGCCSGHLINKGKRKDYIIVALRKSPAKGEKISEKNTYISVVIKYNKV